MKRALKRFPGIFHYRDGGFIEAPPDGVRGDLSGVRGDLDDCNLTSDDRKRGVSISDLLKKA